MSALETATVGHVCLQIWNRKIFKWHGWLKCHVAWPRRSVRPVSFKSTWTPRRIDPLRLGIEARAFSEDSLEEARGPRDFSPLADPTLDGCRTCSRKCVHAQVRADAEVTLPWETLECAPERANAHACFSFDVEELHSPTSRNPFS